MVEQDPRRNKPGASTAGQTQVQRVCIVSDDLSGAPDEGIKKFTLAIAEALRASHEVTVLSARGPAAAPNVQVVTTTRSFVSWRLRAALRRQCPTLIIYAARSSATFFGFVRAWLLQRYYLQARVVLLGLQTRRHQPWQQRLLRFLQPDLIAVQSTANATYLAELGCRVTVVPSGVDLATFHPVTPERRRELRLAHRLDPDRPVVVHVGHLEPGRGIGILGEIARDGQTQVVLVTSSSTNHHADTALRRELEEAGVHLITTYLPRIEEVYQLASCYVFPVQSTDNAIDAPLSVLEALACDLPVVTTRYGGLPRLFVGTQHPGLIFVDGPGELVRATQELSRATITGTRA